MNISKKIKKKEKKKKGKKKKKKGGKEKKKRKRKKEEKKFLSATNESIYIYFGVWREDSRKHLPNKLAYPAKSRMGMQHLRSKMSILSKLVINGSLHTLKEFTILEFTVLSVEIVCS